MRAVVWHGKEDVRVDHVPDPKLVEATDAIIRITATAICGSDIHLYDGVQPMMKSGDILGHEPMGIVEEVGSAVKALKVGDRVVVPFPIACGACYFCAKGLFAACDTSNPNAKLAEKMMGHAPAGCFGFSHVLGGYAGGQAEFLRVPFADVGPLKIEGSLSDEQVLFLSDIFPTGYMAAENAGIEPGDTVAVWGAGPVGQFTMKSAWLLGAGRVIAIDRVAARLTLARKFGNAETINFAEQPVYERLQELTQGRGPDRCIDAVGGEAHGFGSLDAVVDKAKQSLGLTKDRAHVLREAIYCCRKGGTVSVPGVYVGAVDNVPVGAIVNKGLTIRSGQTHVQRYMRPLLKMIEESQIEPAQIITHRMHLADAPLAYKMFRDKKDGCIKVVLTP